MSMRVKLTLPRVAAVVALAAVVGVAATGTAAGLAKKKKVVLPTYTGVVSIEGTAPTGTDPTTAGNQYWIGTSISIPRAKKALQPGDVGVLGGGVENPGCTGSYGHPTASKGLLCIYPAFSPVPPGYHWPPADSATAEFMEIYNLANPSGEGFWEVWPYVVGNGRYGARLRLQAAGPGPVRFTATWAYKPAQ
jgi:hypothetical protein